MPDALLAIVVEDDEDARAARRLDLEAAGFAVMTASTSDGALLAMTDAPGVDLVLTDIHLGGSRKTKAGVALARRLRQTFPNELPVVGYSGVFSEQQLGEADLRLFNLTSARNSKNWEQADQFFQACYALAASYHAWRKARSTERDQRPIDPTKGLAGHTVGDADRSARSRGVFEAVGADVDLPGAEDVGLEEALKRAGYKLRLVSATEFETVLSALPVWVRQIDGGEGWEAQVYGFPALNTFADDQDTAVVDLVNLMVEFHTKLDVARQDGKEPQGPAASLLSFLDKMLASR